MVRQALSFAKHLSEADGRRIGLSEAARRRLRLPASAMPSSSPLSAVQVPEMPIPTS
jgi:hypothetical protein